MNQDLREKLQSVMQENLYMQHLHMKLLEIEQGYVKGVLTVCEEMKNPYGSVHGGVLYSLADVISGFAACTCGYYSSTINGSMNYLKPAMNTKHVYCEAKQIRSGKKIAVYEVLLQDDNSELLETGTFTFYIMNRPVLGE